MSGLWQEKCIKIRFFSRDRLSLTCVCRRGECRKCKGDELLGIFPEKGTNVRSKYQLEGLTAPRREQKRKYYPISYGIPQIKLLSHFCIKRLRFEAAQCCVQVVSGILSNFHTLSLMVNSSNVLPRLLGNILPAQEAESSLQYGLKKEVDGSREKEEVIDSLEQIWSKGLRVPGNEKDFDFY